MISLAADYAENTTVAVLCSIFIGGVSYLALSIYGMILFASKMSALTKLRQSSTVNGRVTFRKDQMKVLYITTKYVTLLSIAMISTCITLLMGMCGKIVDLTIGLYGSPYGGVELMVQAIDCVINIVCLYLQFPSSRRYYEKYCGFCQKCFTYLVTRQVLDKEQREYENVMEVIELESPRENDVMKVDDEEESK